MTDVFLEAIVARDANGDRDVFKGAILTEDLQTVRISAGLTWDERNEMQEFANRVGQRILRQLAEADQEAAPESVAVNIEMDGETLERYVLDTVNSHVKRVD